MMSKFQVKTVAWWLFIISTFKNNKAETTDDQSSSPYVRPGEIESDFPYNNWNGGSGQNWGPNDWQHFVYGSPFGNGHGGFDEGINYGDYGGHTYHNWGYRGWPGGSGAPGNDGFDSFNWWRNRNGRGPPGFGGPNHFNRRRWRWPDTDGFDGRKNGNDPTVATAGPTEVSVRKAETESNAVDTTTDPYNEIDGDATAGSSTETTVDYEDCTITEETATTTPMPMTTELAEESETEIPEDLGNEINVDYLLFVILTLMKPSKEGNNDDTDANPQENENPEEPLPIDPRSKVDSDDEAERENSKDTDPQEKDEEVNGNENTPEIAISVEVVTVSDGAMRKK